MFPSFVEIQDKFSLLPNSLLDLVSDSSLDPYEFRILMFIARQTYGWRTAFDEISLSQFEKTGISRNKIIECMRSLERRDLILSICFVDEKKQQRKLFFINTAESKQLLAYCRTGTLTYAEITKYRKMMIDLKIDKAVHEMNRGGSPGEQGGFTGRTGGGSPGEHTKESIKDKTKDTFKVLNTYSSIPADGTDKSIRQDCPNLLAAEQPEQYVGNGDKLVSYKARMVLNFNNGSRAEIDSIEQPSGSENTPNPVPIHPSPTAPKLRKPKIKQVLPRHNPSGFKRCWDAHNVGKRIEAVPVWDALYETPMQNLDTGELVLDDQGQPVMVLNDETVEKIIAFCVNAWDSGHWSDPHYVQHFCRWLENYGWTEVIRKPASAPQGTGLISNGRSTGTDKHAANRDKNQEMLKQFITREIL